MKRLIFIIWLLMFSVGWATNYTTVTIGDSTWFNYTHTSAIDSAQLILQRGAVNDTLSLMPIVGTSHKICEWEGVFDQVDSSGTYQVWIEPYSSAAIIDTVLGAVKVEPTWFRASRDTVFADAVKISGDGTAADNFETMLDGTGGQILSLRGLHIRGTTGSDTAFIAAGYGYGMGGLFKGGATDAHGLYCLGQESGRGAYFLGGSSGDGFYARGQGSGDGVYIIGGASNGYGLYAMGQGSGAGARFYGGATNGDGLSLAAQGTGLDLNATLNFADVTGQLDSNEFADDYYHAIAVASDSGAGGASVPDSLLEVATKVRSLLMNPLPGSILPNGHLQVDWNADSADIAGWSPPQGTEFYLTSRRAFEGYERSLYLENASINTLKMKLDTGYYEMAAQIWFANNTTDTAYFQCYNLANDPQTWLSSGTGVEYAVGWGGWYRFARLIRLTGDSTFYFTIGANAGDSAYFAEVSLMPYGAVGHKVATAGTGAYSCSLFAYNSGWIPNGGSPAITSGRIRMISGVNEYALPIDANGWVEFSLDGGTWSAYATALRFIQDTIPQTFTFSDHYRDTVTMTAFTPSTPTDTGKVVLYVRTDRILGNILEGATFRVIPVHKGKSWVTGENKIVLPGEATKKTDSNGYAEIEVYQSSFVRPYPTGNDSLKYNISITYPGLSSWSQFRFTAPDSGSQYEMGVRE